jgi:hypothetical protein
MTTQAELTAQQMEEYVRSKWIDAVAFTMGPNPWTLRLPGCARYFDGTQNECWSAAYAFTIDREEEIEALEQDIEYIERKIRIEPQFFAPKRILTRLQQALEELKRGMK